MRPLSTLAAFLLLPFLLLAQNTLPPEATITPDGRLEYGTQPTTGLYQLSDVHKLEITLAEPDWFELMDGSGGGGPGGGGPGGGTPGVSLIGTLTFNDELVLDSVLVSIKGQTSDFQNDSEKKSFKIEIDELKDQDLMGYDNLNLNCGFQDHSGMREVLFYDITKSFAPALKGAFVDLYINGEYWGPYGNIQQIEGRYIKEWFLDNEGTRWRAVAPDDVEGGGGGPGGGGPGGGGMFGTGVSTLNYNGADSTDYNENYTLKKTNKDNPWEDLIEVCEKLNNLPVATMYDELDQYLDIDRTLWTLAQETVFSDDDSYIYKGGMDYYVYWDHATDRLMPLEVDANSVMMPNNVNWSPFYHETDSDFPLLNRLLQNNEARQRYLAHLRTILDQYFLEEEAHARIDEFAAVLDQRVQDDPKKIYSYSQYLNGIEDLKDYITDRINYLASHQEINREGVGISNLIMETSAGIGMSPEVGEAVQVSAAIDGDAQSVMLHYGLRLDGKFEQVEMYDDGMHNDGQAGDQLYGATIPGFGAGDYVRYYVEAIKDDAFATASYFPVGAEHDVYIYQVDFSVILSDNVVINEFMADNEATIADGAGEFDDWIELYNKGSETIDLSTHYLSDNEGNLTKWQFPEGTSLAPDEYLIIWADEDQEQATDNELHCNFKIAAGGEIIMLVNEDEEIIDQISFGEQIEDATFARIPNGTGDFDFRTATFNANNDGSMTSTQDIVDWESIAIVPNPASDYIFLKLEGAVALPCNLEMYNLSGQQVMSQRLNSLETPIHVGALAAGGYLLILQDQKSGVSYHQKLIITP